MSLHDSSDLAKMAHKYNTINIKLDKTGGLSEAVKIVEEAKKLDLKSCLMHGLQLLINVAVIAAI